MEDSGYPSSHMEIGDGDGSSGEFNGHDPDNEEEPDDSSDDESGSESSGHNSQQYGSKLPRVFTHRLAGITRAHICRVSTRSLSGSVLDYPMENGRRYCGWGEESYFMPNDEVRDIIAASRLMRILACSWGTYFCGQAEQTRLSIVHQVHLALLDGELTAAPIEDDIGRILDVGTGTGEWAIAMAEKYPNAEVVGIDLSAIQPDQVPENVFFEIDDAEQDWTYTQNFDLIHMRNLSGSFKDWNYIYEQAFKHLKPGGYLEVRDIQMTQWMTEILDSPSAKFARAVKSASDKAGRPIGVSHIKKNKARQAGFVEIQLGYLALPLGTWPEDPKENWIGKMWLIGVLEGLEATALRLLTTQKDWAPEDVRELCNQVEEQLISGTNGSTSRV